MTKEYLEALKLVISAAENECQALYDLANDDNDEDLMEQAENLDASIDLIKKEARI